MEKRDLKIVVIHPQKEILKKIKSFLKAKGYKVYACREIQFALYLRNRLKPEIIITSLHPIGFFTNENCLKILADVEDPPILIVLLENEQEQKNLNLNSVKIFEFIYLNEHFNEFIIPILESAKKYYVEKHTLEEYLKDYQKSWKKQIEWYLWKEYHKTRFRSDFSLKLLQNIRNSLLQGLGINSIISYVDLMDLKKIDQENGFIIPKHYFVNLKKSAENLNLWILNLEKLLNYMNRSFPEEILDSHQVQKIIYDTILRTEEFRMIKNQEIVVGNLKFMGKIRSNKEALSLIFKEILINAFKYSPERTYIDIVVFDNPNSIIVAFLNDVLEFKGGITGIPEEYENQIFEPFVRLNHHFDERFINEDFSLGTGLTLIKLYLQYFGGSIYLKEVMDYTREPKKRILCGVLMQK